MDEREELEKNILYVDVPRSTKAISHNNGVGLALGGGLARGLAHIGVIKALLSENISPQVVAGTSIGAVVGGCYLADKLDAIEHWALSLNRKRILSYLDLHLHGTSVIGGNKIMRLLNSHLGNVNIENLPYPYAAIATNMLTGHEVWLRKGPITEAMQASFALPGVFPPVARNDRFLVDGALVNPIPVAPCQAMGARVTIAVDLNADMIAKTGRDGKHYQSVAGFDVLTDKNLSEKDRKKMSNSFTKRLFRRKDDETPSLFGTMFSALNIMQDRLTRLRLASDPPDIQIKPLIGHIGVAEFDRAKELIDEGERATHEVIPHIKAAIEMMVPYHEED